MITFCEECGAKIPEGASKCPDCGNPAAGASFVPASAPTGTEPSRMIGDKNNVMGDVTGKKISATTFSENNSQTIDKSQHSTSTTTDNSTHNATTTIINNGGAEKEYCGVCGVLLDEAHVKCPKCGRKICADCRVPGKRRCEECEKKAKDEYRFAYQRMLLDMGGVLGETGRSLMDQKARELDLVAEKNEIEKEFTHLVRAADAGSASSGVQVQHAPEVAHPSGNGNAKNEASKSSLNVGSAGFGTVSRSTSTHISVIVGADSKKDEEKQEKETKLERLKWTTAILGLISVFILVGYRVYCVYAGDTFLPESISNIIMARSSIPATFRYPPKYIQDYTKFEQQDLAAWAKTKTPELFGQLLPLEAQASETNEKMLQIANSDRENYSASPEFRDEKIRLDELERSAGALRNEIADAHTRWAEREPVPVTFRRPECADYMRFDDEKIANYVQRKKSADYKTLTELEKSAQELDGKMLSLAKNIESDPAT